MLLISLPADFTTRIHSVTKIMIPADLTSGPESGRDGGGAGGIDSGCRMEGVGCQDDTINALGGFA